MNEFTQMVVNMKDNECMYVGTRNITSIGDFLRGYASALASQGNYIGNEELHKYQVWMQGRFNITISKSWDKIIKFIAANEQEAIDMFWEMVYSVNDS